MKKILLTIDTEFIISKDEILGIKGKNGLEDILLILEELNVEATFFIDYYEVNKWGEEIFEKISKKIRAHGHQIELHLHPNILGDKPQYLWQYSKKDQKKLLVESIDLYSKFNSSRPKYFRAGGYSANDETLEILKELDFLADLSFQHKQQRCKISSELFDNINQIGYTNGLLQIPTTVYRYRFPNVRYNSINLEWCSLKELKEITSQIEKSQLDYFVVMMHSFSFLKRWNRKKLTKNNSQKKKLKKFIQFAKKNNFEFSTISDFHNDINNNKINTDVDFLPVIKNPIVLISGALEKFKMKFIVNKKFRRTFLLASTGFALILFLFLYIIFFNSFSPGFKEIEKVEIDTRSWNFDNDINSIESNFIELNNYKRKSAKLIDSKGIIFRKPFSDTKKYVTKPGIDTIYIATDMSGQIINNYSKFIRTRDSSYYNKVILYSDWLLKNVKVDNNFATWPHPYKFTKYDLDFDWCGSWALGNILSAVSRRIQISPDTKFTNLANQIVNTFETQIKNGGILFVDDKNNYWFEEYPTIPPNHVLNGHINGILGLYDYWRISGDKKAKYLFDKGIETTIANLDKYDSGYWSYYDHQYPYLADYYYHKAVHIPQLKILNQITGKEKFKQYYEKFEEYFKEPYFTLFKLKMIYDGLHRRLTYKSFFTLGK